MKKLITLMLIAALAFTLFACGTNEPIVKDTTDESVDTAAVRESFDKAIDFIESAVDTSAMTSSIQDDDDGKYLYKYWSYDKDPGNVDIALDAEIGGSTVTVGTTTIDDLKALGFTVELDTDTVNANTVLGFSATKDGKFCNMSVDNSTDKEKKAADMPISNVSGASEEYGAASFVYRGLKVGSSLKDVIDALGLPNSGMTLSADSSSTTVSLSYFSTSAEDDKTVIDTNLEINVIYDAAANTTNVSNFNLTRSIQPAPESE